jgi:hypothetical protein
MNLAIDPYTAAAVIACTAVTDGVYVFFNAAVVSRRRVAAAIGAFSGTCSRPSP